MFSSMVVSCLAHWWFLVNCIYILIYIYILHDYIAKTHKRVQNAQFNGGTLFKNSHRKKYSGIYIYI